MSLRYAAERYIEHCLAEARVCWVAREFGWMAGWVALAEDTRASLQDRPESTAQSS